MKSYEEMTENVFRRIDEYNSHQAEKRARQKKIYALAASFLLLAVIGLGTWKSGLFTAQPSGGENVADTTGSPAPDENSGVTSIDSLMYPPEENRVYETAAIMMTIPIGDYTASYINVEEADPEALAKYLGDTVPNNSEESDSRELYKVLGHEDLQYIIEKNEDEGGYTLWKFKCFTSNEYPYEDVLRLIYNINSSGEIREIIVSPPDFDNTNEGVKIQESIGTKTITDRESIETIYQTIHSLTCYGSDHWELIDYGSNDIETLPDGNQVMRKGLELGRYLSLITDYGNEIDGLQYTHISHMFYEYNGIAYEPLDEKTSETVWGILR